MSETHLPYKSLIFSAMIRVRTMISFTRDHAHTVGMRNDIGGAAIAA